MSGRRKEFWELVDKTPACWLWTGATDLKGYGRFRKRYAHRVSYEIARGEVQPGLQIDHACHVRNCVNPSHLHAVSSRENAENRGLLNGASGVRGVSWHKRSGKWVVQVTSRGVLHYGGLFTDKGEAERVAIAMRNELMTNNLLDREAG